MRKAEFTNRKDWLLAVPQHFPGADYYLVVRPTGTFIHIGTRVVGQYSTSKGQGWMYTPKQA